jgi:hypothetical protein
MRPLPALAIAGLLLAVSPGPVSAGEVFLCADGSKVVVDRTNRAQVADNPCVKAWFAKRQSGAEAQSPPLTNAALNDSDGRVRQTRSGRRRR